MVIESAISEMRLTNSMQVALALGVVGASLALYVWGFSTEGPRRLEGIPAGLKSPTPGQPPSAHPRRSIDTRPAQSAVAEFRKRLLSLEPRTQPALHIATSGKRVARITDDKLVVIEPASGKEPLEFALPGAYLVTPLVDGLLAAGKERILVLQHTEQQPTSYPRPTLFPGSRILPDLIAPGRLWVHHPRDLHLYGYALTIEAAQLLPIAQVLELKGPESHTFLPLRDGSFMYFTGENWRRVFTQGKRFELRGSRHPGRPLRTLRAARIDQFFILYDDARLERVQLLDRLRVVSSMQLQELPIDLTSAKNLVILLHAQRRQSDGLHWSLELLNEQGPTGRIGLGASPPESFRGDWVTRQLEPRGLAASNSWVVVGGSRRVRVWEIKTRELVFDSG